MLVPQSIASPIGGSLGCGRTNDSLSKDKRVLYVYALSLSHL